MRKPARPPLVLAEACSVRERWSLRFVLCATIGDMWKSRPRDWRWAAVAVLLTALVLSLALALRASGLSGAANAATVVSLAPLVAALVSWPQRRRSTPMRVRDTGQFGDQLRVIADARDLTGQDLRDQLSAWDGSDVDAYMTGAALPKWNFVEAFLDLISPYDRWHREMLERRLRPIWEQSSADLQRAAESARQGTVRRSKTSYLRTAIGAFLAAYRRTVVLTALLLAILAIAVSAVAFHLHEVRNANYRGAGSGYVAVQIRVGDTPSSLAPRLLSLGVIEATDPFVAAANGSPGHPDLQPGYVRLHLHMNAALAYAMLLEPQSRISPAVTIPAGLTTTQVIQLLSSNTGYPISQFSSAMADTRSLLLPAYAQGDPDGYLLPGTYSIQPAASPTILLRAMVVRFNSEAAKANLASKVKSSSIIEGQVVIVASLIQAEGGSTSQYPEIARVIYNRLDQRLTLSIGSSHQYSGLPSEPIDNPSAQAITATLNPARGDWISMTLNPTTNTVSFAAPPSPPQQGGPGIAGEVGDAAAIGILTIFGGL